MNAKPMAGWKAPQGEPIPREVLDRMIAHPRFYDAVRFLISKNLDLTAADPFQDAIRKDLGRYLCGVFVLYLDTTGDLTLPRLKDLCVQTGRLSPGRARAFLLYLRLIGYVRPATDGPRSRAGRYVPTAPMALAFKNHTRIGLEALCLIEPDTRRVLDHLDDPQIYAALVRQMGEGAIMSSRLHRADPELVWEVFVPRIGGMQVLYGLYDAALAPGGDRPSNQIVVSISGLSQRAGISRVQVIRLLRSAERAGLLQRGENNVVQLSGPMLEQTADICAINLVGRAICAARALEALAEAGAA